MKNHLKNDKRKIPDHLPKGGRPELGKGLKDKELELFIYNNKISKRVEVKFTQKEFDNMNFLHDKIKETTSINRSDFIKNCIFEKDITRLVDLKNNTNLIKELNKIGTNLNQVTKKVNSYQNINNSIKSQIVNIENYIKQIESLIIKLI